MWIVCFYMFPPRIECTPGGHVMNDGVVVQEENKFFAYVESECENDAIQKAHDLVNNYIFKVANYYSENIAESTAIKLKDFKWGYGE